ncbi:MAG: RNA polymerase sigma factor [Pirellula sp.]|jgi:RNA polymerase sigma-70 factor (ECF subfamily)
MIAQAHQENPASHEALSQLCIAYWQPLYHFYRRYQLPSQANADGEDLVQSFFVWLIESNSIKYAEEQRGRFRTFLLACFKQFLASHQQYAKASKRRPVQPVLSLHEIAPERIVALDSYQSMTAEQAFDYAWALEIVDRAMKRLEDEWDRAGRRDRFLALRNLLAGNPEIRGRDLATSLGMTEGAVRVAIHRMRKRFAELLRYEVLQTSASPTDADEELKYLIEVLRA